MKTVLFSDPQLGYVQLKAIMDQIFTHEGFKLEAAVDAQETVTKAIAVKPDVILLKTGSDTLKMLKENSAIKDIPVIVLLPPKSSPSYIQKMVERGAAAAISMDQASMLQVIDKVKEILKTADSGGT